MEIILNGKSHATQNNLTIASLLDTLDIRKLGSAVAINGNIILQSKFQTFEIKNDDKVEIIRAVGGG